MSNDIVKPKELFYRGQSLEHLKTLSPREVAKYLPSRSRRSVLRKFDTIDKFVKKCETLNAQNKKIKTHLRDIVIVPQLVGMVIQVYNGKAFFEVHVTHQMIGHRLGEFSMTRGRVNHSAPGIGATKSSAAQKK